MSKSKFVLGTVVAAAAGFVAAILTAPKSGKETRADIKANATKAKATVTEEAHKVKDVAEKKAKEVKAKAEEIIEDVADKATEYKGRAEQAVDNAKKGLEKKPKTTKK